MTTCHVIDYISAKYFLHISCNNTTSFVVILETRYLLYLLCVRFKEYKMFNLGNKINNK